MKGLLLDFGGVLTTNVFDSFREFCVAEGLDPDAIKRLFREHPEALELVRGLETGDLSEDEFGERFGALLGLDDRAGLVDRMFGSLREDERMVGAVRRARAAGIRTGLVSNSMGAGRYDRSRFPELFDGVVISGEVGMHKPQPEIFLLGAERAGVDAGGVRVRGRPARELRRRRGGRDDGRAAPGRRDARCRSSSGCWASRWGRAPGLDPGQALQHRLELGDPRVEVAQLLVERLEPRVERLDVVAQRGDVGRQLVLRARQHAAPPR